MRSATLSAEPTSDKLLAKTSSMVKPTFLGPISGHHKTLPFSHTNRFSIIIKYRNVCIDTLNAHRNYRSLNILSSQVTICRMGQKQWRCAQSCESLPKWTSSVFKGHPNFQQCVRFCAGPLNFLKEGNPRINNRLYLGLILGSIGMYWVLWYIILRCILC